MKKKVGVVTGSSKGIGKAIAITFAKSGEYSAVVTNARKMQEAQAVSDEIISLGCNSIPIEADISNEDDCIRLIEETVRNYVRIDVLVNNAGVQKEVALEETTLDVWQKILAVDLT
jgi:NAD(P)-dependent dehydrogenase (short-subunit alcohol dehydrogenase family)